jgi:tetratricopeptide (TPR) repeat protein
MCTHLAQYDRAVECHQKALESKVLLLGDGHLDTAISYAWLGAAHAQRGAFEEALKYHEKALVIRKVHGDENAMAVSKIHLARFRVAKNRVSSFPFGYDGGFYFLRQHWSFVFKVITTTRWKYLDIKCRIIFDGASNETIAI